MRLSHMYHLVKKNLKILEYFTLDEISNSNNARDFEIFSLHDRDLKIITDSLEELKKIEIYKDSIEILLEHLRLFKEADDPTIILDRYYKCDSVLYAFLKELKSVVRFFSAMPLNEVNGFDVKMPPTDNFDEFVEDLNTLQKVLQQCPCFKANGETIKIDSVDIGSIWMRFAVIATSSTIILNNLASLVDSCVKIKSHIITCQQQEEQYRKMKLENDLLENLININKTATNHFIESEALKISSVIEDNSGCLSPEDMNRLKFSISQLSELMIKGMEIYASIDAPSEVKDLFPTSNEIKSLNEPTKLLPESVEAKTQTE